MKSVIIKDRDGKILIKVYKAKHGYDAAVLNSLSDVNILIRDDDNKLIKIKFKKT